MHGLQGEARLPVFDGLVYPSRNNYPAACVALFEHANLQHPAEKHAGLRIWTVRVLGPQ